MSGHTTGGAVRLPSLRSTHLVGRWVVITTLGLLCAGAAILFLVQRAVTGDAEQQAAERARWAAAAILSRRLRPADLVRPLGRGRRAALAQSFAPGTLGRYDLGVRLYRSGGGVAFSTMARGEPSPPAAELVQARQGKIIVRMVSTPTGSVLRTVMPVVLRGGRTSGVIVLDQDFAPIANEAGRLSLLIASVFEGLLLVSGVLIVPALARAGRRLRREVETLDELASRDLLTGLDNRLGFRRDLERSNGRRGLLLVDLESFQEINAAVGAKSGDGLLRQAADRLRRVAGPDRTLGRLGEDEFGVLLVTSERAEIDDVVAQMQSALEQPFDVDGVRIGVHARFGAARPNRPAGAPDELLRQAGVALAVAKRQASTLELYDPELDRRGLAQLALEAELLEALEKQQLLVHYQPQVDVGTHTVRGVEALIRWRHPTRGLVTASEFIEVAERTGLSRRITDVVLATTLAQWAEWSGQGLRLDLAVNLTAVDLLDAGLPETIDALLRVHGVPAEYLVLEVTERTLVHRQQRSMVDELDRRGIRISIDDYGTGYSSLAALRTLPIRQVKLDRSFVSGIPQDVSNDKIVRSTVQLAHGLGATVVAEGIETQEELERLADHGCDIAQGYHVGRPLPADALTSELLAARDTERVILRAR